MILGWSEAYVSSVLLPTLQNNTCDHLVSKEYTHIAQAVIGRIQWIYFHKDTVLLAKRKLNNMLTVYSWIEIRKLWEGLINFISSEELWIEGLSSTLSLYFSSTTEENWPKLAALIRARQQRSTYTLSMYPNDVAVEHKAQRGKIS